jgi:hypothetical protein
VQREVRKAIGNDAPIFPHVLANFSRLGEVSGDEAERIVRNLKRDIKKGLRPPPEYHSMSAGEKWRMDHGRLPILKVVGDKD